MAVACGLILFSSLNRAARVARSSVPASAESVAKLLVGLEVVGWLRFTKWNIGATAASWALTQQFQGPGPSRGL